MKSNDHAYNIFLSKDKQKSVFVKFKNKNTKVEACIKPRFTIFSLHVLMKTCLNV